MQNSQESEFCGSLFYNKFGNLTTAISLKKKSPPQVLSCEFPFVFKPIPTENVEQPFKKRFYVLTQIYLPKTSRSWFSYLSSNKSSVSLLQEFFFWGGGKSVLWTSWLKYFFLLSYRNFNFLIITFSFTSLCTFTIL